MLNGLREDDIFTRELSVLGGISSWCSILLKSVRVGDELTVFIVDDDEEYRNSLKDLFNSVGLKVNLFGSAAELLGSKGCLMW